jgi:outer membrane protein TolC
MKQGFLILFLFIVFTRGNTQSTTTHLSLTDAIQATIKNNKAIKLAGIDEQIATENYKQTDAVYLPKANFSYTAFTTNNPLNAFGFKLQQQSITAADFNPGKLNNPSATPDFTTKIEVQQPLLNLDMVYQRKAAATQAEMYHYITGRTKEWLAFEAEKAYLQLQLAYDGHNVLENALVTSKAVLKLTRDYFNAGLVQKSDLLNAELQVTNSETQLNNALSSIKNASDGLSLLMDEKPSVIYTIDSIKLNQAEEPSDTNSLQDRSDFVAIKKGIEAYDLVIKSGKMSYIPKLNAFGTYQLNDSKMLGFGSGAYLAGLQLSWNIFNGNQTKHTVARSRLEKSKLSENLDKQQSEASVQIAAANRQVSDAMFSIKQQQQAVEQASESLRILNNRYEKGLIKTADVLLAQAQLLQQQSQYIQAVYNYNLSKAYLKFLQGN